MFRPFQGLRIRQGTLVGSLVLIALFAFEVFNFSTTDFALHDLLGDLSFMGIRWATILAVAFCGIDFAGIARIFATDPEGDPIETWYLFGAWFLAALMNAMLTWWGVSVSLLTHVPQGSPLLGRKVALTVIPIFVALLVWLVRVLLIGTIVMAGPRLFQWEWGKSLKRGQGVRPTTVARAPSEVSRYTTNARPARGYSSSPYNGRSSVQAEDITYEPLAAASRNPESKHIV